MTEYMRYDVTLSKNQKEKLAKALINKSAITIRLSASELCGPDTLFLTRTQIKKIQMARSMMKGVDLKISKAQISKVVQKGGSLFTSLINLGTKLFPMATKALPGIATSALSALTDFGVSKALGSGMVGGCCDQNGGFLIPQD